MSCFAYALIAREANIFKAHLKHEKELTSRNIDSLKKAKMEIEAMFGSVK